MKTIFDSAAFKAFITDRGFGMAWRDAGQFADFMDKGDAQMGAAMKAAGLAKA